MVEYNNTIILPQILLTLDKRNSICRIEIPPMRAGGEKFFSRRKFPALYIVFQYDMENAAVNIIA